MVKIKKRLIAAFVALAMTGSLLSGTGNMFPTTVVEAASTGTVVYENTNSVAKAVDFSALTAEDWSSKGEVVYAYTNDEERSVTDNYTVAAKITIDAAAYATLTDGNYIKFQGIVKLGDGWTYTKSDECSYLDASAFTAEGDNYTANISLAFTEKSGTLMEIDFEIVGVGFAGTANISDVSVTNASEESDSDAVYEDTASVEKEVDFSALTEEDWGKKAEVTYAYTNDVTRTVSDNFTVDAKVTIDAAAYATLTDGNYIKFQGIVKLGDDWTYTKGDSWPYLDASAFTADGDNYTADIQIEFKDKPGTLMEVDFEIVGVGFAGTVGISDVKVANAPQTYSVVLYEDSTSVDFDFDFSGKTEEDWGSKVEGVYAYTNDTVRTTTDSFTVDAKVTIDAATYATFTDGNYIKFQGIVKLGDGWTYTKGDSWPTLDASSFIADGDNYTADIQVEFKDKAGKLMEIDYEIVGVGAAGSLSISDVVVTNYTTEKPPLEAKDPTVLSDLSSEDDFENWSADEEGWDYYHGGTANATPEIAYDSANERLKVTVDYSANATSTWSEAKVTYTPDEAVDISQYNQLSVDIIYPDELDGTKMKFFSDAGINKDTTIDETTAEDLGNGMKKVTVTMGFSPSTTPLESVTIGIIGYQTSFKGDIYLDNLVLSQKNEAEDFVEITSVPGEGSPADVSNADSTIMLTDPDADDCAVALFAYLTSLKNSDQVLFGHQNDVNRSVSTSADLGDVEDVTGQVSGVYGIDSLSLLGTEAGGTDAATALANSIDYSLLAAENGAIVSLSMHMPNFSNAKVVKNDDGTYNFFACDFAESKDLSNDIATQILPGGEYNDALNAYLDVIAEYALTLQEENVPIIFRPYHENTGNWFWWGSANTTETYKSLFRYTRDYLESQGVHNMLYVYSPGGPITSAEEYLTYYPGDEYVDILAFDYYDDYNTYPATSDGSFFTYLDSTCKILSDLAEERGKLASISECGVRVMKKDGSDNEGLLVKNNPIGTEATGTNWYQEVSDIAKKNDMPYFLVWANFSDTNFYVPYKYNDTYGQELINDFIDYYNDESSIFGGDANFYENIATLAGTSTKTYTNPMGYMVAPFDMDELLEETTLVGSVENASKVQFVVTNTATGASVTLDAATSKARTVDSQLYSAVLTEATMAELGKTDVATITLVADGVELATISNISLGKEKDKAPANVLEDFDYYSGSNGLLGASYTGNSAAGCSSSFTLDAANKVDGNFGGAFNYKLVTTGSEVWTGQIKSNLVSGDLSAYNAIEMWVNPDGMGQKLVIQLTDASGEEFEVYLTDFVKGTEAQWVTIPFSSFVGKQGGTLDTANITKFAIWCNSIIPEGYTGTWEVDSKIFFDGIKAVSLSDEILAANPVDKNGLIITDKSLLDTDSDDEPSTEGTTEGTTEATTEGNKSDGAPNTGDTTPFAIIITLMCMAVVLAGTTVVVYKKKER